MRLNCIVIEDEPLAMMRLKDHIEKVSFLNLISTFDNAIEPIPLINSKAVDLMFLDVQMDDFDGFHLLETITIKPEVILTTAFDRFALKGYEHNLADYLLKPYSFERFLQAVQKVHQRIVNVNTESVPFIFVKTEYRLEKVDTKDILFIEGQRDYRKIHTREKKIMTLETFKDLDKILPRSWFCRVHKSYVVGIMHINQVERDRIKIQEHIIPISDTYSEDFYRLIARR